MNNNHFKSRHIGPRYSDLKEMLKTVKADSLEKLVEETVPASIRLDKNLNLSLPLSEFEFLSYLREIASKNEIYKNYIGLGYYPAILPAVIQRNIFENPGWYTQYTPYQAEISQGRLEALLNYQTVITDMTGLHIANASLLDEGTAAAEAVLMAKSLRKGDKVKSNKIFISEHCFPQTIEVVKTRALPLGIEVITGNHVNFNLTDDYFAVIVQYPAGDGEIFDYTEFFRYAKSKNIFTIIAADLMSLALLKSPAEIGADVAVGSSQRFGIPLGYGGPHAGYFATREEFKRQIPGRIIGVTIDAHNNKAYRMALQTREQHIKREKATSNICTAQVLLAIMAGMYAVYHGPEGIKSIASNIHHKTVILDDLLKNAGLKQVNKYYFDTIKLEIDDAKINKIRKNAESRKINLRYGKGYIGISICETASLNDIMDIVSVINGGEKITYSEKDIKSVIPSGLKRTEEFLTHPVFNRYHSEMEMQRYIKSLENKDLSLTASMIPLGSCTMKLNAAAEMYGVSYPEFTDIHPFAPLNQVSGYTHLIDELGKDLCEITGFVAFFISSPLFPSPISTKQIVTPSEARDLICL